MKNNRLTSHSPGSQTDKSEGNIKTEIFFNPRSMYKAREINSTYQSKFGSKMQAKSALKSYYSLTTIKNDSPIPSLRADSKRKINESLRKCKISLKEINKKKKVFEAIKDKLK